MARLQRKGFFGQFQGGIGIAFGQLVAQQAAHGDEPRGIRLQKRLVGGNCCLGVTRSLGRLRHQQRRQLGLLQQPLGGAGAAHRSGMFARCQRHQRIRHRGIALALAVAVKEPADGRFVTVQKPDRGCQQSKCFQDQPDQDDQRDDKDHRL